MAELRLSASAKRDLENIQDRGLAEFGLNATRAHMAGFEKIFEVLRTFPEAGQKLGGTRERLRVFPHPPHRLIYEVGSERVLIVRILHHAQDVGRHLPK